MQGAFAQGPGLDAATRHAAAGAAAQAGRAGQAALLLAEREAVVAQQGQHHRQHAQRQLALALLQQQIGHIEEERAAVGMRLALVQVAVVQLRGRPLAQAAGNG
ncbi:hypothetical protein G6F24_015633 [Rhizopus arrhizus]|nr:hypothetical protein G6F24_015633 [Rhizopus arrhizus]